MPGLIEWLTEHEATFRKSRLPSLYSDLSVQKSTNPEGYAANVSAWGSALVHAAAAGKLPSDQRLVIQASDELLDALVSPQYGRPSGLGLVFNESVRNNKMMDLKDFEDAELSIYHRSWVPSPASVLRWGLKQAGLVGTGNWDRSGRLRSGQLVAIPTLEDMFKQIQTAQSKQGSSLTDRIMTREAFSNDMACLDHERLSPKDTEILLRYLSRDKGILSYDSKIVKFRSAVSEIPEPIMAEETTIANLKSLISSLESQIVKLNARVSTLQKDAKLAVQSKNKAAALSALRSKKLAEGALNQRTSTLTQLEEVYNKIEQAADQVQIVEVMQSSAVALKRLNQKVGGVEKVEDVVEELREEMGKVDEVNQILQEPLNGNTVLDEAEVDDELEEMEREERRKDEERQAEATRRRLAELEAKTNRETGDTKQLEQDLRTSMDKLDAMKIADDSAQAGQEREQTRMPEHTS